MRSLSGPPMPPEQGPVSTRLHLWRCTVLSLEEQCCRSGLCIGGGHHCGGRQAPLCGLHGIVCWSDTRLWQPVRHAHPAALPGLPGESLRMHLCIWMILQLSSTPRYKACFATCCESLVCLHDTSAWDIRSCMLGSACVSLSSYMYICLAWLDMRLAA